MALDLFPLGMVEYIVGGIDIQPKRRVLTAKFGNSYEQVAEDGLNTDESIYTVTWEGVSIEEAEIIFRFLSPKLMVIPFLIDLPGVGQRVQVKCTDLKKLYTSDFVNTVSATLQRDYTL